MSGVHPLRAISALRAHTSDSQGVHWVVITVWGAFGVMESGFGFSVLFFVPALGLRGRD